MTATAPTAASSSQHLMQCMEVWGGNQAFDNTVAMPGLDAWVFSLPHDGSESGGDIHYVSSCATGRIARFVVADVSGHGPKVSEIATALRTLMRKFVNYVDQARVVDRVNRSFLEMSGEDGSFATAIVGTYWAPTGYLVLCNAGHPRPLHYDAAKATWSALDTRRPQGGVANIPLGVFDETRFDQLGLTLQKGDLILAYTDSLTEARNGQGTMLGETGLLAILGRLDATRPHELLVGLRERLHHYRAGADAADDVTMLLLRHTGERPRATLATFARAMRGFGQAAREGLRTGFRHFPWPQITLANLGGALISRLNRLVGDRKR